MAIYTQINSKLILFFPLLLLLTGYFSANASEEVEIGQNDTFSMSSPVTQYQYPEDICIEYDRNLELARAWWRSNSDVELDDVIDLQLCRHIQLDIIDFEKEVVLGPLELGGDSSRDKFDETVASVFRKHLVMLSSDGYTDYLVFDEINTQVIRQHNERYPEYGTPTLNLNYDEITLFNYYRNRTINSKDTLDAIGTFDETQLHMYVFTNSINYWDCIDGDPLCVPFDSNLWQLKSSSPESTYQDSRHYEIDHSDFIGFDFNFSVSNTDADGGYVQVTLGGGSLLVQKQQHQESLIPFI